MARAASARYVDPGTEGVRVVEELAHLGEPRFGEGSVVLTGGRAHERNALEPEQVGQRVLVDGVGLRQIGHSA
jgi:hypothetical protein